MKQMFGNTLMISVQLAPASLEQTPSLATETNPQPVYIQTGALVLYKQTGLVAEGLIRRRPANPIKSLFVPRSGFCLKTGRVTREEGGDWQSVHVVVVSVPICVYAATVKHRYNPGARRRSLLVM